MSQRTFKVQVGSGKPHGRYTGSSPSQAAKKAFTQLIKDGQHGAGKSLSFTMIESTQGSNHKSYSYQGKRVKLSTPKTFEINGQVQERKYENHIKRV